MVEFQDVEWANLRQVATDTAQNETQDDTRHQGHTQRGDRNLRHFASTSSTLRNSPFNTPHMSRSHSKERPSRNASTDTSFTQQTATSRVGDYVLDELEMTYMGAVIIVCFFTSGLIDAVAFNSWNCFVGMQTGNTVFAALGIGGQPAASHNEQYYKSLVAIAAFMLGTLFFNFIHRWTTGLAEQPSARQRIVFVTSFLLQTLLVVAAAVQVQLGVVSNRPYISGTFSSGSHTESLSRRNYADLAPIALLSFQAAGQVCLSRVLSLIELPTIVLSTLYHDFTADLYTTGRCWKESSSLKDFILDKYRRQQKRLYSIVALFVGALVGGEMYKSAIGMSGALWLAVAMKLCITVAFACWKRQKPVGSDSPV